MHQYMHLFTSLYLHPFGKGGRETLPNQFLLLQGTLMHTSAPQIHRQAAEVSASRAAGFFRGRRGRGAAKEDTWRRDSERSERGFGHV